MAGINKVILVGNVGKIESKSTAAGKAVVSLSIATSYKSKSPNGEPLEVTEWHNCTLFDKVAEIAMKYVTKGTKLYVEGALKTDKWQTESGETRYATKIIVREMQMLSSPKNEGAPMEAPKPDIPPPAPENSWIDDEIPF